MRRRSRCYGRSLMPRMASCTDSSMPRLGSERVVRVHPVRAATRPSLIQIPTASFSTLAPRPGGPFGAVFEFDACVCKLLAYLVGDGEQLRSASFAADFDELFECVTRTETVGQALCKVASM